MELIWGSLNNCRNLKLFPGTISEWVSELHWGTGHILCLLVRSLSCCILVIELIFSIKLQQQLIIWMKIYEDLGNCCQTNLCCYWIWYSGGYTIKLCLKTRPARPRLTSVAVCELILIFNFGLYFIPVIQNEESYPDLCQKIQSDSTRNSFLVLAFLSILGFWYSHGFPQSFLKLVASENYPLCFMVVFDQD